ncbi:MAG: hypothetical protein IGS03_17885 [Candidatus Sericytochromatia bacterium]|nr:hypothetical protein [Candidatus Sericytochromatia bacterium]
MIDQASVVSPPRLSGWLIASWGLGGFLLLLIQALIRLSPMAWVAISEYSLALWQWGLMAGWTLFMAISEGYKGFQKAFAPRFGARLRWLRDHPQGLPALLAPFFCMGFFGATRKRKLVSWILTMGIVIFVLLIKLLPQPWRGIIDVGVVVGLSWGVLATVWFSLQALFSQHFEIDPELSDKLAQKP